ncbi:MAG TPA: hypothetical protein VGN09_13445 [Vicinamibacteria bacterium]|jgi:hypothetical protein
MPENREPETLYQRITGREKDRMAEALAASDARDTKAAKRPFNETGVKFVRSTLYAVSENAARTLRKQGGDTPEARQKILDLAARDVQGAPAAISQRVMAAARVIVADIGDTGDRSRADLIAQAAGVQIGSDIDPSFTAEPEDTRTTAELADEILGRRLG